MAFEDNAEVWKLIRYFLDIKAPHAEILEALNEAQTLIIGGEEDNSFGGHCRRLLALPSAERSYVAERIETITVADLAESFGMASGQMQRRALLRHKGKQLHAAFLRGETQNRNLMAEEPGLEEDKGRLATISAMGHMVQIATAVGYVREHEAHPLLHDFKQAIEDEVDENEYFLMQDPGQALLIFCDLLDEHFPVKPAPKIVVKRSQPPELGNGRFSF